MKHKIKRGLKGSVTVEAAVVIPVFLSFLFILMFFVKVACVNITLDHAVNETAKQLATSCYPITFINEIEDDLLQESTEFRMPTIEEEVRKIGGYVLDSVNQQDIMAKLLTGEFSLQDVEEIVNSIVSNIKDDFKDGLRGYLGSRYAESYFDMKTRIKYAAASHLMGKFLQKELIDDNNLRFIMVELPQGVVEYEMKSRNESDMKIYDELKCVPDPDNVVIAVEYRMRLPISFFHEKEIVTRHVAVEKAWLHGSNGIYEEWNDNRDERDDSDSGNDSGQDNEDDRERIVYVTNYGSKYHEDGCEYLKKSRKPISLEHAVQKGYTPCKVCVLKTAEYVWKKK